MSTTFDVIKIEVRPIYSTSGSFGEISGIMIVKTIKSK